jgi:Icc-related predicted phosphoesterase
VLDGTTTVVGGIGFAGICGTAGGFTKRHALSSPADGPAARLEAALQSLETPYRVALLHYAPIRETLHGEDPALFQTLGSARLGAALDRGNATIAFHGHAHHGAYAGHTEGGTPVFNVAMPVLHQEFPDRPPYVVFQPRRSPTPALAAV